MNMTDPKILETERNGRPDGEEEPLQCELCLDYSHTTTDLRVCKQCTDKAASYGTTDNDKRKLRQAIGAALRELEFGQESQAASRLKTVLEQTK